MVEWWNGGMVAMTRQSLFYSTRTTAASRPAIVAAGFANAAFTCAKFTVLDSVQG
jgi:hypothetical protein